MSSILKALKKLEHDKSSYRPEELNIDTEILRSNNSSSFSAVRVLIACLLLLAGGSTATYIFMKQEKAPESANLKAPVQSRQSRHPVSMESDIKTEQLPAAIEVVPAEQQNRTNSKTSNQNQPVLSVRTTRPKPARTVVVSTPVHLDKSSVVTNRPLPSVSVKAVPALRVNGIAYLGESSDNVAMINGVPLSRGAVIEGVTVEEIYKSLVRFSYGGEMFEIRMGQSNR